MPLLINDLLSKAEGKQREILRELKRLNKEAYQKVFLMPYIRSFKAKYRALQKTSMWTRAKELLIDYFLDNKKTLYCKRCGRKLMRTNCVMHHTHYELTEIFTPLFINFVGKSCHDLIHEKKQ